MKSQRVTELNIHTTELVSVCNNNTKCNILKELSGYVFDELV